jgi:hypothetical protein
VKSLLAEAAAATAALPLSLRASSAVQDSRRTMATCGPPGASALFATKPYKLYMLGMCKCVCIFVIMLYIPQTPFSTEVDSF